MLTPDLQHKVGYPIATGFRQSRNFTNKLQHSIELLKKSERLALQYFDKGFYLAFSGGKDSQALYHVAKMAGVKFEAHYALTTLDPPELVRFIKRNYPDVVIDRPEQNFHELCLKKKALPTRLMRFCCAVLKETKGAGTVTLTGVRRQESLQRSRRNEAEIVARKEENRFTGSFEQLDQFTRTKEVEGVQCINGKDKIVINPIIEWTDKDVWHFLNEVVRVKHCELYDVGWHRIGCLFCPMASKKEIAKETKRYPKYKDAIVRTIHRLRLNGYVTDYKDLTDNEVFEWWVSKEPLAKWYADNKKQLKLKF
jgi:phosphoadenosine phosphosulfate reductase